MDTQDAAEKIAHNQEMIQSLTRQLRTLDLQASKFGPFIPPHVQAEIANLKQKVMSYRIEINKLQPSRPNIQAPPSRKTTARTHQRNHDRISSIDSADSADLDRRIQTVGKANFVLLCADLLQGRGDDERLMALIPDTNKLESKRSILSTARRLVDGKHTYEVLTRIIGSSLDAEIIAEAQRIRDTM